MDQINLTAFNSISAKEDAMTLKKIIIDKSDHHKFANKKSAPGNRNHGRSGGRG